MVVVATPEALLTCVKLQRWSRGAEVFGVEIYLVLSCGCNNSDCRGVEGLVRGLACTAHCTKLQYNLYCE